MLRRTPICGRSPRGRIGRKLVLAFVSLVMLVVAGTGWALYALTRRSLEREMSDRLVAVAQLLAGGLSGDVVGGLRPGDEVLRVHAALRGRLERARDRVGARRIYVFDRQGRSLLDTEPHIPIGREYPRLRFDRAELASVWAGLPSHSLLFKGQDGVFYKSGYAPIYDEQEIVAGVGVDIGAGFLETISRFQRSVLILAGASAVVTVAIGLGLARTITGPVHRLVTAAREIGRGNLHHAVETPSRDELGYLGDAMDEMRREILARDAQLRRMLAGVAHEIRNPLGGIEIYAGVIADDLPDEDPRKAHIQKVIGEVKNLNRIISEFLDFARPAQPSRASVSVAQLAQEAAFLLGPEMERERIRYVQETPADLQAWVDPEQLKRALLNLMRNGVQSMRDGGALTLRAERTASGVVVEVRDSGPGMTPEVRERIFEPFFTTKGQGAGLGLAIVREIVEGNGGIVEVESAPDSGTTFRVTLPAADAA